MRLFSALLHNLNDHILLSWWIAYKTEEKSEMTQISARGFRERACTNPEPAQTETQFLQV